MTEDKLILELRIKINKQIENQYLMFSYVDKKMPKLTGIIGICDKNVNPIDGGTSYNTLGTDKNGRRQKK